MSDHTVYLPASIQVGDSPTQFLISSARVKRDGEHDAVMIWTRGGLSGLIVVQRQDTAGLMEKLGLVHRACPACGEHGPEDTNAS
jgi:hypothetical protein